MQRRKKREFEYFFQFYFHAIQLRRLFFVYPFLTKNILVLLDHLEKQTLISGYKIWNVQKIKVFLRYDPSKKMPLIQKFTLFSIRGRKRFISAFMLKSFVLHYPTSFALIGTKYGILSLQQCQKFNCGGELIFLLT
jgi:ribosomal protein S8